MLRRRLGIIGLAVPLVAFVAALIVLYFWGESEPTFDDAAAQLAADYTVYALDPDGRRAALVSPLDAKPDEPLPLVIALHGYGSHVWEHAQYMGLIDRVAPDRFRLLMPNGTRDDDGNRFWSATDFCCDFDGAAVDDAAYLRGLVDEVMELVAQGQVYVVGHSNGAFMAYRLACDGLPELTGIVALAGASFADEARCADAEPVSILHIHGDADRLVFYEGEAVGEDGGEGYPGAVETVMRWARRLECDIDADEQLPEPDLGLELRTAAVRYQQDCRHDATVEHWRILGGGHEPNFDGIKLGATLTAWMLGEAS